MHITAHILCIGSVIPSTKRPDKQRESVGNTGLSGLYARTRALGLKAPVGLDANMEREVLKP